MTNTLPVKIKVVVGSVRQGRFAEKAAQWIAGEVKKQAGVEVEILDLKDFPMPFFDAAESPSFKSAPYSHPEVVRFTQKIAEGDGFILVSPEYNHGTSGVLKNALDWVYQEWNNKAVGFVSYGSVGGARAVEQLRLNAVELQMAPVREAVHMPGDQYFPVLFGQAPVEGLFAHMQKAADKMIPQLLWWTRALKAARQ